MATDSTETAPATSATQTSKAKVRSQTVQGRRPVSHFGCVACKRAKVKCDEARPGCTRCQKQRIQCSYSQRWRKSPTRDALKSHGPEMTELEVILMHQWCTRTSRTLCAPEFLPLFQVTLPEIGFKQRVILDAIFVLSAAHLYHVKRDERAQTAIDVYKGTLIASLRESVERGLDRENGEAVFAASGLLAIFSMICDTETDFTGVSEAWMPLFQGMQHIYSQMEWWRHESCFAGLHDWALHNPLPDSDAYLPQLSRVLEMETEAPHDVYLPVIQRLSRIAEQVFTNTDNNSSLIYIVSWIIRLPREFVKLIDQFDPCALTILANFFAVLSYVKDIWVFGEYAIRHQKRIKRRLPEPWYQYLEFERLQ